MSDTKKKRIIDTIVKALGSAESVEEIERKLDASFHREGFARDEVQEAFGDILDMLNIERREKTWKERGSRSPLRVLSRVESVHLTSGARSEILGMYYRGEMDFYELEELLNCVSVQSAILDREAVLKFVKALFNRQPRERDSGSHTVH